MNRLTEKSQHLKLRKRRIRAIVSGTTDRPRLSIFISNRHISAQIIDDTRHATVVQVTTVGKPSVKGSLMERATWVGDEIAKKAKAAKVKQVVFDRNGRLYHGRVQALADAARKGGLEF